MRKTIFFITVLLVFQGCAGVTERIIYSDSGQAYKMEEVYSIGLFTPTYQYKRASACAVEEKLIKTTKHGSGYMSKSITNCQVLGLNNDGFTNDTTSPVGPALLQAGATVGTGALIKEGLENQPQDNISNSNQQGQIQGQKQYQRQYQNQRQYQYQRNKGKYRGR